MCVNDEPHDGLLVPFADSWKHTTLAECCYSIFSSLFEHCMGDYFDNGLPPCSPPPGLAGL